MGFDIGELVKHKNNDYGLGEVKGIHRVRNPIEYFVSWEKRPYGSVEKGKNLERIDDEGK